MWQSIGKLLLSGIVPQIESIVKDVITKHSTDSLKSQAFQYLDGILAEGQIMSKDKLDEWFTQKRAELKKWGSI